MVLYPGTPLQPRNGTDAGLHLSPKGLTVCLKSEPEGCSQHRPGGAAAEGGAHTTTSSATGECSLDVAVESTPLCSAFTKLPLTLFCGSNEVYPQLPEKVVKHASLFQECIYEAEFVFNQKNAP